MKLTFEKYLSIHSLQAKIMQMGMKLYYVFPLGSWKNLLTFTSCVHDVPCKKSNFCLSGQACKNGKCVPKNIWQVNACTPLVEISTRLCRNVSFQTAINLCCNICSFLFISG